MSWLRKITVEPAMFLQQAGDTLTYVIFQNLFIDKICKVQLKYDDTVCQLYETEADSLSPTQNLLTPIMNQIQEKSSDFLLYNSLVENSLPVLLVLFLGVWSDTNKRRKPCLLLSLVGKLCRSIGLLVNAYFMNWHPYVLLFTVALPHSIGGSNGVFHMAAFSYLADSSVPRSRTWRLGVAEACWALGSPVGLYLGAFLFEQGGYLCVFSTAVVFHLIAVLYTAFILPEVPLPRKSQYSLGKHGSYGTICDAIPTRVRYFSENDTANRDFEDKNHNNESEALANNTNGYLLYRPSPSTSTPNNAADNNNNAPVHTIVKDFLIGSIKAVIKERPNHTRKSLLSLGLIMLLSGIMLHGEVNMKYLFTRNKFHWREQQFSLWTIFDSITIVLGLTIILPICSKILKFSDPFSGAIAALGRCFSKLCIALAPSSIYLYIGSAIDITGVIGPLSARSLASKCVLRDERGQVFAFLGCIEALVPLIAVPLYSLLYSSTLAYAPSTIYFVSAGISIAIFLIFGTLFMCAKLKIIEFSGTDTSALTSPTPPDDTGFFYTHRRFSLS